MKKIETDNTMSGSIPDIIKTKEYKPVDESYFLKMAHVLHSLRERYPNFIFFSR
jgi:hypothetical protein